MGVEAERRTPTVVRRRAEVSGRERVVEALSRYLLPLGLLLLLVGFSIALPDQFATTDNLRNLVNNQVIIVFLAIGVIFPLAAGEFDLSVGYVFGLAQALVIGLVARNHMPDLLAIAVVLVACTVVGIVNGLLDTVPVP